MGTARRSVAVALLLLAVALPAGADPAPVEIGTLDGAYLPYAEPRDINERGQVIGYSNTDTLGRPFSWTEAGGIVDLGSLCNDRGGIASFATDTGHVLGLDTCAASPGFGDSFADKAFSWMSSQGMAELGPAWGEETVVYDAHAASGRAVGFSCRQNGFVDCRAFHWIAAGGLVAMNEGLECFPYDVNGGGQAVGYCGTQAFLWSEASGMQFLAPLSPGDACYAQAISESGQVVGNCTNASGRFPFSWTAAGGMVAIGVPGSSDAYATVVNSQGQVGGDALLSTGTRAFAWTQEGGAVLIDPGRWTDTNLLGLTESGHFVGFATQVKPASGLQYAFVWTQQDGLVPLVLQTDGSSQPRAWNDHGQVVGSATNASGAARGFSWTPGVGIAELPPVSGASPAAETSAALVVNNRGQVAGISYLQDPGTLQWRYTATLWNTMPLPRTPLLAVLPDANSDGYSDIAVLRDAPIRVEVRSGTDGALLDTIPFHDDAFVPLDVAAMPDSDGNGVAELLVLAARRSGGRVTAEIRNLTGPSLRRLVTFASDLDYIAVAVTPADVSGNGAPEIAVLGTNANGRPWAQVKDALTGGLVGSVYFDPAYEPFGFEVVGDVTGEGTSELAVLGVDPAGRVRAQAKDLLTGALAARIFFDRNFAPSHAAGVDFDGDGNIDALAVLGEDAGGVVRAQVKDVVTAARRSSVRFESGYVPEALVVVPDLDESGAPELALLQRQGEQVRAQVKDAAAGQPVGLVGLSSASALRDAVVLPDVSGNGKPELAVLGEDPTGGYVLEVRDAATGELIRSTPLP